jgi:hypothetical protein
MRQLPKAEYQLMKLMIDHFNVDDPCELFTVLLRLGYEVTHFTQTIQGEQWIRRLINEYRSNPDEDRQYEL